MLKLRCLSLLILLSAQARYANAQTYSCQPATANAAVVLRNYVVRLTGGDPSLSQTRQLYQLPAASSSSVQVVTQSKTCKTAAAAYHLAVRGRRHLQFPVTSSCLRLVQHDMWCSTPRNSRVSTRSR